MVQQILASTVCAMLMASSVESFSVRSNRISAKSNLQMTRDTEQSNMDKVLNQLKSKLLPIAVGASLFLNLPSEADAASSGGRSGGSSFRSSPMRSSTRLGGSSTGYSSRPSVGFSSPMIMPMPMYSPFGFSPFGFGGGFMPINFNFLIIAGVAYVIYNALSNRVGGSDFSNGDDVGALGNGASVIKIQVALSDDWSQRNNIMNSLSTISNKYSAMSGRNDLSKLLSDASLALLRKEGSVFIAYLFASYCCLQIPDIHVCIFPNILHVFHHKT